MALPPVEILWITENYFPATGGMAQSCDRIVSGLRKNGFRIHVLYLVNEKKKFKSENTRNGTLVHFPVTTDTAHSINLLWNYLSGSKSITTLNAIVAFGGNLPVFIAPIFAQWLQLKLITLIRGNDFDTALFTPKKRDDLFYALTNSRCIVTVAQSTTTKIAHLFPQACVQTISNGIDFNHCVLYKSDLEAARNIKANLQQPGKRIIGLFGHLKQKKGVDFFIEALHKSGKSALFQLLLIGETDPIITQMLAETEILYQHIPYLPQPDLLKYYAVCDLMAIPSHYDGLPNVLLEAAALQCPVLVSDAGGLIDVVPDPDYGLLFKAGNLSDCIQTINRLTECSGELLHSKAVNLYNRVKTQFSSETEIEKYKELLSN